MDNAFVSLGMTSETTVLTGGLSALHVILWKFTIIDFVQVDTCGHKYDAANVWKAAVRRMESRMQARAVMIADRTRGRIAFGQWDVPSMKADDDLIRPLGAFDVYGTITRSDEWERTVSNAEGSPEP